LERSERLVGGKRIKRGGRKKKKRTNGWWTRILRERKTGSGSLVLVREQALQEGLFER